MVVWEELATSKLVWEGLSNVAKGATHLVSTLQSIAIKPLDKLALKTFKTTEPLKNWALNVSTEKTLTQNATFHAYSIIKIVDGKLCFGKELDLLLSTLDIRPIL